MLHYWCQDDQTKALIHATRVVDRKPPLWFNKTILPLAVSVQPTICSSKIKMPIARHRHLASTVQVFEILTCYAESAH